MLLQKIFQTNHQVNSQSNSHLIFQGAFLQKLKKHSRYLRTCRRTTFSSTFQLSNFVYNNTSPWTNWLIHFVLLPKLKTQT